MCVYKNYVLGFSERTYLTINTMCNVACRFVYVCFRCHLSFSLPLFLYAFFNLILSLQPFLFLPSSLWFFWCCFLFTRPHTVSKGYCISCRVTASSLSTVDMVDTQQLLAWPVGFSLSAVDLSELDDSSHSLDMKHLSTLDYASISSSSIPSSLSPPLVSSISSAGVAYDPSPPQNDEQLTNMDFTNMHSYRMEPDTHSKSVYWVNQS